MEDMKILLLDRYALDMKNIEPQQGGWAALAYKAVDGTNSYFLKVYEKNRASTPKLTALIDRYVPVTVWLNDNSRLKGRISVPLLTKDGHYKCEDEHRIYMLYDYIKGETIGDRKLDDDQVYQLAHMITELHAYGEDIPCDTDGMKENFDVPFLASLRNMVNGEKGSYPDDVWTLIPKYGLMIEETIRTVEELSRHLKAGRLRMALCHTDLHGWNLMQSDKLILIDWEGLKLAPVEADWMFFVDKPYCNELLRVYRDVHPDFAINPEALRFYQVRRRLEDIWEFIEQLLFDEQDEEERLTTVNHLKKELEDLSAESCE